MRKYPVLSLCCVCLLVLATSVGAGEVLRFGVCLSLTGEFSEAGKKNLAGVMLRLEDFNANSKDVQLEAVVRDDKSDAAEALRVLEELAVREKVPAIIGPMSTNLMLGMRDRAAELEVVLISPTVTSPRIGKNRDWAFRVLFDDEFQGVALARFLVRRAGLTRTAAIINDRLAYAGSVYSAFKTNIQKEGGTVVREEHYEWVADEDRMYDFTQAVERVDDAKPDIVVLPVNSTEIAAIIRCATRLGTTLRFCGGDTWQHENVLISSGNCLEDALFISGINFDSGTPAMVHYRYLYDHSHDPHVQLSSVLGYDALSLLIEAAKSGHDSQSIKDALYRVKDFELATGTITIDPERGSEKTAYIHRITEKGGEFVADIIDEIAP
ncbi:MAG: ABC transporter substrate-binding protein [Planctomycetaceae bacterium]|nr:ABC transporter substrate-binding protein [Planctomycetaceae bacterium]